METFLLVFNFCATLIFTRSKLHQWCFSNLILKIILCFLYILVRYRQDTTLCHNSTKNASQNIS